MKPITLLICFLSLLISSCDGDFIEAEMAINLVYPLANETCEDANLTENSVEVPFRWTAQGDFDSFSLIIDGETRNAEIIFDEDKQQYEAKVPLAYRNSYSWKVIGKSALDFNSENRTFSTPATFENNNYAPYPVLIETPIISPGQVILNWKGEDPDRAAATDDLRFEVYLDESNPPTTLRNTDNSRLTSITVQNLERKTYYVLIIAIDSEGNSSSNTISFEGE